MAVYVMSDIHGLKERFNRMIQRLNVKKKDRVYILGDVIDRGPDGIDILFSIMNNPSMTLILGNHELMMLNYYLDKKGAASPNPELEDRWLRNGGKATMDAFDGLLVREQEDIIAYLQQSPLAISDVIVNDHTFYLVHGAPVVALQSGPAFLDSEFLKIFSVHDFVWERLHANQRPFEDRTVIVGHTITSFYQAKVPYEIWGNHEFLSQASIIDVDCGCAINDENTQLGCLCLDDFSVYYT